MNSCSGSDFRIESMTSSPRVSESSCGKSSWSDTSPSIVDATEGLSQLSDDELDGSDLEPIAICGLSLRFPQDSTSAESFWKLLCGGRCAMTEFPKERMNLKGFYNRQNRRNTLPVRGGHFITQDLSAFDADFFSISPMEAASMDPMQRMLLEVTYHALENAGIRMEDVSNSATSVFTGSFGADYMAQLCRDAEQPPVHAASGYGLSMLANRISWFYNLHGPSIGVDSACSSTAMALDLACQSLRSRSSDMALVAGSNLTYAPETFTWLSNIGFLSPDSRCHSFDHRANGYARGEGIAVLVIKRLSDALTDANTIRAVIRATGSNENGRSQSITQPCRYAQERLIRDTYAKAGLSMAHTRYFEAHGTGTAIGDPREAHAIGNAFQKYRSTEEPLYVGAVKSNIGHLEGASGLAGVIKVVLALEHGIIPPNTNFEKCNPKIDAEHLKIKFPISCEPWPAQGLRRASIAAYGYGGANSHVIVDDAYNFMRLRGLLGKHNTVPRPPERCGLDQNFSSKPQPLADQTKSTVSRPRLLVFSAADAKGIGRTVCSYAAHFNRSGELYSQELDLSASLAYNLDTHRSKLPWRAFAISDSIETLHTLPSVTSNPTKTRNVPPRLAFVFTGQGAQWHAMGRELINYSTFETSLEDANKFLKGLGCSWTVHDEFLRDSEATQIDSPELSQTLCTILQVAVVDLLSEFGVRPAAVVGHSSGEIAAAYCAGHISRESAWKLAYYRGVLSKSLAESFTDQMCSSMMSVGLSEEKAFSHIESINAVSQSSKLTVSCVNSPNNITVAGQTNVLEHLKRKLESKGVFARMLRVPLAYHSPQMNAIADEYVRLIGKLKSSGSRNANVIFVSSVTSDCLTASQLLDARYWSRNLVSTVLFSQAILLMCANSETALTKKIDKSHLKVPVIDQIVEIGPHSALETPIRDTLRASPRGQRMGYCSILRRGQSAMETTMRAMGELYSLGYGVRVRLVNEPKAGEGVYRKLLVDLPGYSFDHSQSHSYETRMSRNYLSRLHAPNPLLGVRSNDWNSFDMRWRNFIRTADLPWVEDHKIDGTVLYPAAGMLVMILEAVHEVSHDLGIQAQGYILRGVTFESVIDLSACRDSTETQVSLRPIQASSDQNVFEFAIYTFKATSTCRHCHGQVAIEVAPSPDTATLQLSDRYWAKVSEKHSRILSQCDQPVNDRRMYEFLKSSGLDFGSSFRRLQRQHVSCTGDAIATLSFPQPPDDELPPQLVHPTSLDAILHLCLIAFSKGGTLPMATYIPVYIDHMWISAQHLTPTDVDLVTPFSSVTNVEQGGFVAECGAMMNFEPSKIHVLVTGLQLRAISRTPPPQIQSPNPYQTYTKIIHKPSLNNMTKVQLLEQLRESSEHVPDPSISSKEISWVIENVLQNLLDLQMPRSGVSDESWKTHYLKWAHHHLAPSFEIVCQRLKNTNAIDRLFVAVATNLIAIFNNEVQPLQLLFGTDLVKNYYDEIIQYKSTRQVMEYVRLLSHENPSLRILEVGAGTGSGTRNFVRSLLPSLSKENSTLQCQKYDFTDISPLLLAKAQVEFESFQDKMNFQLLDMKVDFAEQGFEAGSYDVVIAIKAVHATSSIKETLSNIRRALKPGGKLIMEEAFEPSGWILGFVFGLLSGWWAGVDEGRTLSPNMSIDQWDEILKQTGFSGSELVLQDPALDQYHRFGFTITTAVESNPLTISLPPTSSQAIIIGLEDSLLGRMLPMQLRDPLEVKYGMESRCISLRESCEVQDPMFELVILITDCSNPALPSLQEDSWLQLKSLIRRTKRLLWLMPGGGNDRSHPGFGFVDGFCRVLRSEYSGLHLVTLALENPEVTIGHSEHVVKIVNYMMLAQPRQRYEQEYIEIAGVLHTRRVIQDEVMKHAVNQRLTRHCRRTYRLNEAPLFGLDLEVEEEQANPSLLELDEPLGDLGSKEVEISVNALSLDGHDRAAACYMGEGSKVGRYCAGVVLVAGDNSQLLSGDRVFGVSDGGLKSRLRLPAQNLVRIPDSMSFTTACALLPAVTEAHYTLLGIARAKSKDSILIQNGHTSTGKAVIALCQYLDVSELFVTCPPEHDPRSMREELGVSDNRVLTYYSLDQQIKELSSKGVVDVVVTCTSAAAKNSCIIPLRPFGCFVQLHEGADADARREASPKMPPNTTFYNVDISERWRHDITSFRDSLRFAASFGLRLGLRKEWLAQECSVSHIDDLFQRLKTLREGQRIVATFVPDESISLKSLPKPRYMMDSGATYIVAGGLGGIGRAIARWLVTRGVRFLVLLSRRGPQTGEAHDLVAELRASGVHLETPACDITDQAVISAVLDSCCQNMPPVKGCIQASMVIKDIPFEKMQFSEWTAATEPKMQGTWNLHTLLPKGLDFFIMFSSVAGVVGAISQANYAAGNTYLDALARHRIEHGEHGVSLCIGPVADEGYLTQHADLLDGVSRLRIYEPVWWEEIRALLDIYCDPYSRYGRTKDTCQPIVGIKNLSNAVAEGAELPASLYQPLWQHMHQTPVSTSADRTSSVYNKLGGSLNSMEQICTAASVVEAAGIATATLNQRISTLLGVSNENLDAERPMHSYGVDSLAAIDLRNFIARAFDVDVGVFDLLGGATTLQIGLSIAKEVRAKTRSASSDANGQQ